MPRLVLIPKSACGQLSRFRRELQPGIALESYDLETPVLLTGCRTNGPILSLPEIASPCPPSFLSLEI